MIKLLQAIYFDDLQSYGPPDFKDENHRGFWKTSGVKFNSKNPKANMWTLRRIQFDDSKEMLGETIELPEIAIENFGSFVKFEKIKP